jgi:ABC-type multidrug transport system fused ATPase/permease subunit
LNEANRCRTSTPRSSRRSSSRRSSCSGRRAGRRALRGARLIDAGSLEIGTLIAAAGLLSLVFQPLQELSELYGQVQAARAAMGKISTVLDAVHDVHRPPGRGELGRSRDGLELDASSSRTATSP